MSDLFYEFVKGQGWQVQTGEMQWYCDIYTIGEVTRRVTVIDRAPKPGERGWFIWGNIPLKAVWNDLTNNGKRVLVSGWPVDHRPIPYIEGRKVYTVEVELLTKKGWELQHDRT